MTKQWVFVAMILMCFHCITSAPNPPIKAVNLGGWLVTEGWIQPSLFHEIPGIIDGIRNQDFLDGNRLQFKSVNNGMYLSSENGGGGTIVVNRWSASGWETFRVWRVDADNFQFLAFDGHSFIGLQDGGSGVAIVATATKPGVSETFQIVTNPSNSSQIRIKASNNMYWRVNSDMSVTADALGNEGEWGDGDPSIFNMTVSFRMKGEYQVTNGYGATNASIVMNDHWKKFITEDDFIDMARKGINAVRIPVGWWIAHDPPPLPFVNGSLAALDNAFTWAQSHGLGVLIDLHAAPGGQNPDDHSGTRDGIQSWGEGDTVQQTVDVIDFLTERYATSSALLGVELMNEPRAPGVTLSALEDYYKLGYNAVRKHSSNAYVIMSNRLNTTDPTELLSFASGFSLSVLDVHYYNLYQEKFKNMSAQDNIEYVYENRARQLNHIVTLANGRPLVFVGEWVAEWNVNGGASKTDYQNFAKAQLDVFGKATFGWAYWTWKNVNNHWSLQWMINNGYITLT